MLHDLDEGPKLREHPKLRACMECFTLSELVDSSDTVRHNSTLWIRRIATIDSFSRVLAPMLSSNQIADRTQHLSLNCEKVSHDFGRCISVYYFCVPQNLVTTVDVACTKCAEITYITM